MSYPQNNSVYPQDGRRPVIINAHPNNGQNFPKRNVTLSRPERQPTMRRPMMRMENRPPPAARAGATSGRTLGRPTNEMPPPDEEEEETGCWVLVSRILTFWAIGPVMSCFSISNNKGVQQAWREKIALCIIIVFCWGIMGFFTVGIQPLLCPDSSIKSSIEYNSTNISSHLRYMGNLYKISDVNEALKKVTNYELPAKFSGTNITPMFRDCNKSSGGKCVGYSDPCTKYFDSGSDEIKCVTQSNKDKDLKYSEGCLNSKIMKDLESKIVNRVAYGWDDIEAKITKQVTVYNGLVIDLSNLQLNDPKLSKILPIIRRAYKIDATRYFEMTKETKDAVKCFSQLYSVGKIDKVNSGCFLSRIIMYVSMISILGIVLTRFCMAIIFSWFVSSKLVEQQGGNTANKQIYTICLVTAYSEGEDGIRTTLNSLASTTYPDKMELLFVIADGIIFGSGNDRSTPDICTKMIVEDPKLGTAEPKSYFAIADGAKQHNMAKVHAGVYIVDGHKVPAVVVVKCGTPAEQKGAKPGNRGKRDSQLLLMNFLSRVTFDDRMTPLDYDLFKKIQHIAGVTPDKYEIVLMVDADTKVMPTSLSYMIAAVRNDPMIMGLCGETRIANKTTSWVTWIQVFEYYISHHLGKSFESLFGGVTCLPGCFCMYRIKAPKPGSPNTYVPVLANPDIVEDYSENIVDTLHKKNLLLLGEDRFLTTLMLRTFPKRKMVFVPQALCKTIVPDEFKVLLSQRRRWINSTIHNLMELVLVRDLCGTFCFSMQFVVGMELFGTVVLPAAIIFTVYLIISLLLTTKKAVDNNSTTSEILNYIWEKGPVMPILMLVSILGLPGILIMLTSQKIIYVLWMFVYLAGLPVWNLILPAYAFWHFDDFSWGETRKVEGDTGGDDHSKKEGVFDASSIPLKRWHEYEKENRLRAQGSPYINGAKSPYMSPNKSPLQRLPSKGGPQQQRSPSNPGQPPMVQRLPSNRQPQGPPGMVNRSGTKGSPTPFTPKAPNPAYSGPQRMGSNQQRPPYIPPQNNNGFR